ncbi:MAG TPA: penicillin-binding protein 2 [Marmoricola sp.]|jgi:peptidoglycan glycosyltransferase|nr:penicillin-binding protein 2 [Marmoricola sp.]
MNRPIRILAVACLVLFLALLGNASYVQYWEADSLSSLSKHPDNIRVRDAEFSRQRGAILVRGRAIAESNRSHDQYKYQRVYPHGREYAQLTGYFSRDWGITGIESSQNSILSGSDDALFVTRVVDLVDNQSPKGGNVVLTIDPAAQKAAYDGLRALGPRVQAAVVALQPSTGKVLAMASSPTYDPNKLASHDFSTVGKVKQRLEADKLSPLDNRAIETVLPPGSTFKLVTAAAALETGRYNPDSLVPGGSRLDLPQTSNTLPNENGVSCGGGKITLTRALMVSCNVAFGSLGLKLGPHLLRAEAEKFGFGRTYFHDLDDPITRQAVSQFPKDAAGPLAAYAAIGQYDVRATPLQMAMVAAGIANGGMVRKPYLVDEIQSPNVKVLSKTEPQYLPDQPAMSPASARELTKMMVAVVDGGTGTTAQIPGVEVAGKTGTAQSAPDRPPYAWFVSFAPAQNAQVAVAVLVQDAGVARDAISGSGLAAPIAKAVMEAVLHR